MISVLLAPVHVHVYPLLLHLQGCMRLECHVVVTLN